MILTPVAIYGIYYFMNDKQYIEIFHLLFLDWIGRKMNKAHYVLKGGCNLRFFFRSVRYSEDMDIDVSAEEPPHALRDKANGVLSGKPFRQTLLAHGIEIEHITESEQTETVQRWKLGLLAERAERPLPTKIEFSRRGLDEGAVFEQVDPGITASHRLSPFLANHYNGTAATRQKFEALQSRQTPQARDVFDLYLLRSSGVNIGKVARDAGFSLPDLLSRVMDITHTLFVGQVLAYLPTEEQARYDDPHVWDAIVLNIAADIQEQSHATD